MIAIFIRKSLPKYSLYNDIYDFSKCKNIRNTYIAYNSKDYYIFDPYEYINSHLDATQDALSINIFCEEVFDLDLCLKHLIKVY
ncbi:MAG: hypothetical protein ACOC2U_02910 [bacterium]